VNWLTEALRIAIYKYLFLFWSVLNSTSSWALIFKKLIKYSKNSNFYLKTDVSPLGMSEGKKFFIYFKIAVLN